MSLKKATRADVAREAGVTETIVSYVVNDNRYVRSDKRKRVLDAIEKLGYVPSPQARAIIGMGSRTILLMASNIDSPHFRSLLMEFQTLTAKEGLHVSLCRYRDDRMFIRDIISWNYDGILIGSTIIKENDINNLISHGIPVVILEMKHFEGINGRYAIINTGLYKGTQMAMNAFKERGRSRIAFAGTIGQNLSGSDYRLQGYLENCIGEPIVIDGAQDNDQMASLVVSKWKESGFDALLCRTDVTACVAMKALRDSGARIPEDISVIGFDNTLISQISIPTLTTVKIRRDLIAEYALRFMKELRKNTIEVPEKIVLEPELIIRESL